jgi:hypothetical protein
MSITVIDFPASVLPAVEITWSMDVNHGVQENPYSGVPLNVRGFLERWRFSMKFQSMTRAQAQTLQGFFLEIEGPLHAFRMRDPSQACRTGTSTNRTLAGAHAQYANILTTPSWAGTLKAGDWLELPSGQYCKVVKDVADGATTIQIWPRLWLGEPDLGSINVGVDDANPAQGIFQFKGALPEWSVSTSNTVRPFTSTLRGVQLVLQEPIT